jgi:hypothetical protein
MGAFSKELWITIAVCVPIILWTLSVVQSHGGDLSITMFQIGVVVVGSIVIWRMGSRILEAVTRVWERIDQTRAWDRTERSKDRETSLSVEEKVESDRKVDSSGVSCIRCGYSIPATAAFCKHCGAKQ